MFIISELLLEAESAGPSDYPKIILSLTQMQKQVKVFIREGKKRGNIPEILAYLENLGVNLEEAVTRLLQDGLASKLPFRTLCRLVGAFLCEGSEVIIRFGMALLKRKEAAIVACTTAAEALKALENPSEERQVNHEEVEALSKVAYSLPIKNLSMARVSSSWKISYAAPKKTYEKHIFCRPRLYEPRGNVPNAVGLRALPSEFQRRLLQRLPKVDESLSAAVLLNLVTYEHSVCQYPLRMNEQELAQLQRLAESRDSLSCLPHCAELVQKLCQAYFGGQLAPLKLPKEDEDRPLGCFKDVPLSASLGASARRVALEASKKMAIGLDKEMELSLRPSSGDQVFRSWLPKFNTAAIALVLRSGEGEDNSRTQNLQDGPKLLCSADWLYPIEAECGELHLSASLAAAHRPIGWLPDCLVLCRCLLRRQDCHWQLEATCFHRWQEWSASSAVLEEGRQLLRFEVQEVPVQLVGHQPSTADVQIMLTLREPFVPEARRTVTVTLTIQNRNF
eukprot:g23360.t1